MRSITLALFTTSILALPACGGTPDEATSQSSGTDGDTTTSGTDPTTNPTSTTAPDGTTTGATTTGASDSTTDATTGVTTGPTTGPTPETSTTNEPGTTSTDGTTDPVDTTTDGTTTEPVDTTTTDGTTSDGTTGAASECAALNAMECQADAACMPLGGGKLNLQKMCVSKPMFLGCVDAGGCGDALTYACAPNTDPPEPWLFPSTCLPEGWEPCDAPSIDMPCK